MLGIWTPQPAPNRLLAGSNVAASVTGTLVETTLATITLPAGALANNGQLMIADLWTTSAAAASVTRRLKFGGVDIASLTSTAITSSRLNISRARTRTSQVHPPAGFDVGFGTAGGGVIITTANLDADVTILLTAQLSNIANTMTLEGFSAWIRNP